MGKKTRKKLFIDESRIGNIEQPIDGSIGSMLGGTNRSILLGYFFEKCKSRILVEHIWILKRFKHNKH